MKKPICPFCELSESRIIHSDANAVVIRDGFPVSEGHTLIIPCRHIGSFFDLTESERTSMLVLLDRAKQQLDAAFSPAGYNIGVNDGAAAGQTIGHPHIHLIPRYHGDQPEQRQSRYNAPCLAHQNKPRRNGVDGAHEKALYER